MALVFACALGIQKTQIVPLHPSPIRFFRSFPAILQPSLQLQTVHHRLFASPHGISNKFKNIFSRLNPSWLTPDSHPPGFNGFLFTHPVRQVQPLHSYSFVFVLSPQRSSVECGSSRFLPDITFSLLLCVSSLRALAGTSACDRVPADRLPRQHTPDALRRVPLPHRVAASPAPGAGTTTGRYHIPANNTSTTTLDCVIISDCCELICRLVRVVGATIFRAKSTRLFCCCFSI